MTSSTVQTVSEPVLPQRRCIEEYSDGVYAHAVCMANEVGAEPNAPRVAKRQRHRQNAESDLLRQYYLRNVAIPFMITFVQNLILSFLNTAN